MDQLLIETCSEQFSCWLKLERNTKHVDVKNAFLHGERDFFIISTYLWNRVNVFEVIVVGKQNKCSWRKKCPKD